MSGDIISSMYKIFHDGNGKIWTKRILLAKGGEALLQYNLHLVLDFLPTYESVSEHTLGEGAQ